MNACAIIQIVVASLLQLLAVILLVAAIATPEWLLMFDPPSGQYHKHGLWQVCVQEGYRDQGSHYFMGTTTEKCTFLTWPPCRIVISATRESYSGSANPYPFTSGSQFGFGSGAVCELTGDQYLHHFNDFNLPVLVLLAFTAFMVMINILVACCGAMNKAASACWCASAFIAAILAMSAIITYGISANYAQIRYITLTTTLNAQYYGYSFYLAVAGMVLLILNALLSAFCTVLMFSSASRERVQRYAEKYADKVPWGGEGRSGRQEPSAIYKKEPQVHHGGRGDSDRFQGERGGEKVFIGSHTERPQRMTEAPATVPGITTVGWGRDSAPRKSELGPNLTGSQVSVGYHSHNGSVASDSNSLLGDIKAKAGNVRRFLAKSLWSQESSAVTTTRSGTVRTAEFNNTRWRTESPKKREASSYGEFEVKKFHETSC